MVLNADSKAALAMFAAVENRNAQRSMLMAAAAAKLDQSDIDLLATVLSAAVKPVMTERDKLAHWAWGFSTDIPNALLLQRPEYKMALHFQAIHIRVKNPEIPFDPDKIFVVTEDYLAKLADRIRAAKDRVTQFMACIWQENTPEQRAEWRRRLSNEPLIRAALDRQSEARRKNQEAQQPSRQPKPNGAA
jgi:hypothetical protein